MLDMLKRQLAISDDWVAICFILASFGFILAFTLPTCFWGMWVWMAGYGFNGGALLALAMITSPLQWLLIDRCLSLIP